MVEMLSPDPEGRPYLGIHAVNVYVRDQDASLRFYLDQLGFNLAFDKRFQTGDRWVAVAPPNGAAMLSLIAPKPDSKQYELIGRASGVVFVTENVIAKYAEWRKRGVQFLFTPRLRRVQSGRSGATGPDENTQAEQPVWGGVFTRFRDPDGNTFSLVGLDDMNREIEAQRRKLAEKLEAERRRAQELDIAKQVQARLFPQTLPRMQNIEYAAACIQAREVGGDYHDVLDLGSGRYAFVIADIAGKGIAAALLMANLQANLRSQYALAMDHPQRLLRCVNQLFYDNTDESAYATLFFAEYDDRTRRLKYANCGHLPPLVLGRDGQLDKLDSTATVVGLFREWDCEIAERHLAPGDLLALYTDGITEAFNGAGEQFGEGRLVRALEQSRGNCAASIIETVVDEVGKFSPGEQDDDITFIVAKSTER